MNYYVIPKKPIVKNDSLSTAKNMMTEALEKAYLDNKISLSDYNFHRRIINEIYTEQRVTRFIGEKLNKLFSGLENRIK